jgi:hypothetical protein
MRLSSCDMTTNAVGQPVSFQERLADISHRYAETSVVSQAIRHAQPALARAIEQIQHALEGQDG